MSQAQNAKVVNRAGAVQEARDLWITEKKLDKNSETSTARTLEQVIDDLVNQNLLTEDEKDQIIGNESKGIEATGEVTIGNNTIVFETVRKPGKNPYDKDGWTYAWVCDEDGNWIDMQYDVKNDEDKNAVKAVEERKGIVAKIYEIHGEQHLVIEGIGKMGPLMGAEGESMEETPFYAWVKQLVMGNLQNLTEVYVCDGIENIGIVCLAMGTSINKVELSNTITSIELGAFMRCSSLRNITIPNSVTSIGGAAFSSCTSLESIIIPNNVKSIEAETFDSCENLSSLVIPTSIVSIDQDNFAGCAKLDTITYKGTVNEFKNSDIGKDTSWSNNFIQKIKCTDGEITIE